MLIMRLSLEALLLKETCGWMVTSTSSQPELLRNPVWRSLGTLQLLGTSISRIAAMRKALDCFVLLETSKTSGFFAKDMVQRCAAKSFSKG